MKKYLFITICLACIICSSAIAENDLPDEPTHKKFTVQLGGQWKITFLDNKSFSSPACDDTSWKTVELPGSFIRSAIEETGARKGIAWLRKTIVIPDDVPDKLIGLMLGSISNADEVYINGIEVGKTGSPPPNENSQWNRPRYYVVQQQLIRPGEENTIAMRISYSVFADVMGPMQLLDYDTWTEQKSISYFTHSIIGYCLIAMASVFSLLVFLFFIKLRQQVFLYFFLQQVVGFFIIYELSTDRSLFGSMTVRMTVFGLSWVALNVFHPALLHRFYGFRRPKIEYALWIYLTCALLSRFVVSMADAVFYWGVLIIVLTLFIGVYNVSCHILAIMKKRIYAKSFGFFGVIAIAGAINDGMVYFSKYIGKSISLWGYPFDTLIFPVTGAFFFTGSAYIMVLLVVDIIREVDDLNTSLEGFVIENALLYKKIDESKQSKSRFHTINEHSEEKIKKVMKYIEENYSFDISREGLAASIDVHPDNLGKLFKAYTGKKLGDYVNALRISEAIRKLKETDATVIQIAFDIGFESLRTFNRAFVKCTGMTPDKYRTVHQVKPEDKN